MFFLKKTISQLFEEQAQKTPNSIAVVFKNKELTYQELNKKANQLAGFLIEKGLKNGARIGAVLERSLNNIIVDLAILKIGAICVPINITYPQERINYMLVDSRVKAVIVSDSTRGLVKTKQNKKTAIININNQAEIWNKSSSPNPKTKIKPDSLSHIFYTSGSTGQPKGVLATHRGIINQVWHRKRMLSITKQSTLCHNINISNLISALQFYSALLSGSKLVLFDEYILRDPGILFKKIDENKISVLEISASLLGAYLDFLKDSFSKKIPLKNLKKIFSTGSKLNLEAASLFSRYYPKIELFNAYGQTECSGMTLYSRIQKNKKRDPIPIGKPSLNTQAYILDQNMKLVPPGIPGELYISGDGLARGYLNQPQKTKEVFLPHPFIKGKRIYKTGDIVKMLPDGNIVYLYRVDHQVKIRGNRVELGEVESQLNKYPAIKSSVVVAREDKSSQENYLAAYYLAKEKIDTDDLRSYLKQLLPDYMIPSYFIQLDKFPLNPSGKLDRPALPEPDKSQLADSKKYQPPRTDLEKQLVAIWQEILEVKKIGINDNFFALGGHSLKAIRVIARIKQQLSKQIELKHFFQNTTIRELAEVIEGRENTSIMPRAKTKKYYPLSAMQELHLLWHQNKDYYKIYDNYLRAYFIEGDLRLNILEKSLNNIISRHESFRTNYAKVLGKERQKIKKGVKIKIPVIDLRKLREDFQKKEIKKIIDQEKVNKFNLKKGLLLRAKIIKLSANKNILVLAVDHIASDEESLKIFIKELNLFYNSYLQKKQITLPLVARQVRDYAEWQEKNKNSAKAKENKKYWEKIFNKPITGFSLPIENEKNVKIGTEVFKFFKLEKPLEREIENFCKKEKITLNIFFFALFKVFLYKITGQKDIVVKALVSERSEPGLENTIGALFRDIAIRTEINPSNSLAIFIKSFKNSLLESIEHKEYSLSRAIEAKNQIIYSNQYPDMMFSFLGKSEKLNLIGLSIKERRGLKEKTRFDLKLIIMEERGGYFIVFNYKKEIFKKETINKFFIIFSCLLKKTIKNKNIKIGKI